MTRAIRVAGHRNWPRHRGGRGYALSARIVDEDLSSNLDRRSILLSKPITAWIGGTLFTMALVVGLTVTIALALRH